MAEFKLSVAAGERERRWCPVTCELPTAQVAAVRAGGAAVPFQTEPAGDGKVRLTVLLESLAAGATLELVAVEGQTAEAPALTIADDGAAATVLRGPVAVSTYHYADPKAARPYWYPVRDPFGGLITRGFPMHDIAGERQDHPHHRSVWCAYGDVNGSDNWSEGANHAQQTHEGWHALAAGALYAKLDQRLCWRDKERRPVLDERRVWRLWNTPAAFSLWDVELDLTAAPGVGDVTFGDTKEGGLLSVRVATSMDVPAGKIENAIGGINEGETWGKRAAWCDYSGPVNGNWVGLTIFDHPTSFRHPTWWHVRNYGLMTANCFGLSYFTNRAENGTYVLPAGQTLRFRYRLYVHAGDATAGGVATRYHDYAHPPTVKVG